MSIERVAMRLTMGEIPEVHFNYFKTKGLKLVCKESADDEVPNDHFHLFFEVTTINSLRMYCKKNFQGGNAVWSIKKCDDNFVDYLKYICKGTSKNDEPKIVLSDGYNIKELHDQYWERNAELKEAVRSIKRKRVHNVLEECWDYIQDECTESSDGTSIGAAICKFYHEHRLRFPVSHAMSSMINTYLYRFNCQAIVPIDNRDFFRRMYPNLQY